MLSIVPWGIFVKSEKSLPIDFRYKIGYNKKIKCDKYVLCKMYIFFVQTNTKTKNGGQRK